ncbi:MAG: M20/M25/M40 family metallo-hydrolase [Bryobacterales bacterium]|nr:M20/M25/M40 family metallo-hydrolase [Bryobacterales bacterium]
MIVQSVLAHLDPERIARDTLAFIEVRSETGDEGAGSQFLANLLRREGFAAELDEFLPGRPNVLCRIAGAGGGRSLLFNGHTDTIPTGSSTPPSRDGAWVVGRGAEDMKGGLVAMVHAASALRRAGVRLAGDLWLTGVVGHEAPKGKKEGPRRLIAQIREGAIRPDAIVIVEGPCAIWAASLGSAIFNIAIESGRGPVHTVHVPYEANPARWAGWILEEFARLEREFAERPPHPLCGRERVNVGIVAGGDYMNRLPTPLQITGTWRWQPGKTQQMLSDQLTDLCGRVAGRSGLTVRCTLEGGREPFETARDHPVVRALGDAAATDGREAEVVGMPIVGDANLYSNEAGVATVYYGPAYKTAHSDDERVEVAQLLHCARVYALAAVNYCGAVSS